MRILITGLIVCWGMSAFGCGEGDASIDTLENKWHQAMNNDRYEELFDLLDVDSRRRIGNELKELRGLEDEKGRYVIDQLGGERIKSLDDLEPRQYFARQWHVAWKGRKPKMTIEEHGGGNGYMRLSLDGRDLRVQLTVENDRWVWRLPDQPWPKINAPQPPGGGADPLP